MKTKLVISDLVSSQSIDLKESQQKQVQGGAGITQIAFYSPGSVIVQYIAFPQPQE